MFSSRRALISSVLLGLALSLASGSPAHAVPLIFNFASPIPGESVTPDTTLTFEFDEMCTMDCELTVTLSYNDSGGLTAIGQTLSGVVFDAVGMITFQINTEHSVIAEMLVGAGSAQALTDFGGVANSDVDVSGHWAFGTVTVPDGGNYALSSVGDIFNGADTLGNADLLTGTIATNVEANPPDGTSFSIVDPNTCQPGTCDGLSGGFQDGQGRAWIQSSVTATLVYDGELLGIDNATPIFGTTGTPPIPEPSSYIVFALGTIVAGSAAAASRRRA
jgi:hypothetical protein